MLNKYKLRKDDPQASTLHVDGLLTEVSIGSKNDSYIVADISPTVRVPKQSDKYAVYDQSHWFRDEAKIRGPGTVSEGGGWSVVTSNTYFADRFSFRHEIDDEARSNADDVFNLDAEAAMFVADKIMLKRENSWATDFFTTSVWTTDKTGGTDFTKYSDYGASTPVRDLTDYATVVEGLVAKQPNTLILGKLVWDKLRWHPDVVDAMKVTDVRMPTPQLFASLVEMDKVLIGKSLVTTTAKGTAEASVSYTRVWGKHALMLYVPSAPSRFNPSACYTFVWDRVPGAEMFVLRHRNDEREVDIIEGNSYFDHKVTSANSGLFLSNAVA